MFEAQKISKEALENFQNAFQQKWEGTAEAIVKIKSQSSEIQDFKNSHKDIITNSEFFYNNCVNAARCLMEKNYFQSQ